LTYDSGERTEKMFSVNPSPKESQLTYAATPEAVNLWRVSHPAAGERDTPSHAPVRLAGVLPQRLWWWMVLAGLTALLFEAAILAKRKEGA
jgi:hypothetical protein